MPTSPPAPGAGADPGRADWAPGDASVVEEAAGFWGAGGAGGGFFLSFDGRTFAFDVGGGGGSSSWAFTIFGFSGSAGFGAETSGAPRSDPDCTRRTETARVALYLYGCRSPDIRNAAKMPKWRKKANAMPGPQLKGSRSLAARMCPTASMDELSVPSSQRSVAQN